MPIKTIAEDEILAALDPMRTVVIMKDIAAVRSDGLRAGDHLVGIGGTSDIAHREHVTFGEFKTAAVIQFDTEAQAARAVRHLGIKPGHDWMGQGPGSSSADIWANGDTALIGETFKAIASAKGAHVLYDGGLAEIGRERKATVAAWLYEHDGMVHDRNHPASLTVNRREGVKEPWNERAVEIEPAQRPVRGNLMEFAPTQSGAKLWAALDDTTLKALKDATEPTVTIVASRQDLKRAIDELHERHLLQRDVGKGSTATAQVLSGLAPAIAQPQWERGVDGKLAETGKVKSGVEALEALAANFGRGEYRRITLDKGKAEAMMRGMDGDLPKIYPGVVAISAARDLTFQAARAAAPAKREAGASR